MKRRKKRSNEVNAGRRGTAAGKRQVPKTTLPACQDCGAKCCHDLVMPIEKPKTDDDISELKWELQYDTVRVFIRSHRWYRLIQGRCIYLDANNRCTIYERRPRRCREMKPPDCEHFGEFWDVMITTPEELDEYFRLERERRRQQRRKRRTRARSR